ncbi:MAG: EamA family transporter [Deltaproteobacteria bacterium]|nr:EamA family transporter [Deltaproteobacteria bacterium]
MSLRNFAILLVLSLIWGASFLFIKVAVATIPPLSVAFGRTSLAAVVLYLVLRSRGFRMPGRSPVWGTFLLMGFFNGAVPYTLITWAEIHLDSGLAAIINAVMPLFTVLLAHFFTRDERLNIVKIAGIFLGFCGVVALIGPAALKGLGKDVLAQLAVMAAALCYAIAIILGRRLQGVTPLVSATGQLCCAAFLTLPMILVFDAPWSLSPSFISLAALTCLSLLGTALAYLLYYYLLPRIGSTNLSLVTYLIPITGVFWGALLLGERLHWSAFLALGLILAGIAGVNNRLPKLAFTRKIGVETTAK